MAEGEVIIDGDAHMRKRPIAPLVDALRAVGVRIEAPTGCPPVRVTGSGPWPRTEVTVDAGLSSQYASALMMAAACQASPIIVHLANSQIGGSGYLTLTLSVMAAFGADVDLDDHAYRIAPTGYRARRYKIAPDASAATYFWAAEQLTGGAIELGFDVNDRAQPDAASWTVMQTFPRLPATIDGGQMQDSVPTLAVLAAFGVGTVRFTGIENLRVKECDRTSALCQGLNALRPGLAEEDGDDLVVHGDPDLVAHARPAVIETHDDHRIAMSFGLAGLRLPDIAIVNPDCVAKTFPGYWDALRGLGVEMK